jgi:hypothetical protein
MFSRDQDGSLLDTDKAIWLQGRASVDCWRRCTTRGGSAAGVAASAARALHRLSCVAHGFDDARGQAVLHSWIARRSAAAETAVHLTASVSLPSGALAGYGRGRPGTLKRMADEALRTVLGDVPASPLHAGGACRRRWETARCGRCAGLAVPDDHDRRRRRILRENARGLRVRPSATVRSGLTVGDRRDSSALSTSRISREAAKNAKETISNFAASRLRVRQNRELLNPYSLLSNLCQKANTPPMVEWEAKVLLPILHIIRKSVGHVTNPSRPCRPAAGLLAGRRRCRRHHRRHACCWMKPSTPTAN